MSQLKGGPPVLAGYNSSGRAPGAPVRNMVTQFNNTGPTSLVGTTQGLVASNSNPFVSTDIMATDSVTKKTVKGKKKEKLMKDKAGKKINKKMGN